MKSIFNLVLFLLVICILVIICNRIISENQNKPIINEDGNKEVIEDFENLKKNIPKGNPTISFDYESVPKNKVRFDLEKQYYKELESGATVHPQYTNDTFSDQKVIHDNRMYEKPIHRYRKLEQTLDMDALPSKISDLFDKSITDFKKLTPLKEGYTGEFASEGGFNQASYNPDFMSYKDEKPENGGIIPGLYDTVYASDPLLETGSALF